MAGSSRTPIPVVRDGTPQDTVGGLAPARVAEPSSTEELSRTLTEAAGEGRAVTLRGGGTAQDWGPPPRSLDLLVDTSRLSWIDHDPGDLVVEVGAGTPVADLYAHLAKEGQRLSYDPVRAGGTVGGAVATGASGPRRLLHGALRDLVIGMTVVRPDGVVARSGGRVVKNVAGYDLAKLHTGGHGTLGAVASVAFRLQPEPAALRLVEAEFEDRAGAERALAQVRESPVVPSAVELSAAPGTPFSLKAVLEGTPDGLRPRADRAVQAMGQHAQVHEGLPSGWGLRPTSGPLAWLSVPPAESVEAAALLGRRVGVEGCAPRGALHLSWPEGTPPAEVASVLEEARARPEWAATLVRADPGTDEAVDRWGEVPGLALMRAVKDSFDPDHRFAPGRGPGGT
ncbi:FAD-binding oxidoreductase [Nocardiopsis sp. HNM0947]|uniref:FAD-binding oxidoreductase n=1 Tax=Nocardiopsis coralli TaxID=2772213 RepID=A0ABR9PC60_9ACTN|nr:FAD-binding oxidoreductase [Nocardiopsis coralli]MBE3001435.1 FAD-binding oxidoreductase [Nocardiopsis coralli]